MCLHLSTRSIKDVCRALYIKNEELEYLDKLVRGVYFKESMQSNSIVTLEDVYYAIPKLEGQISCQEFRENMIIKSSVKKCSPLMNKNIIKKISGDLNEKLIST